MFDELFLTAVEISDMSAGAGNASPTIGAAQTSLAVVGNTSVVNLSWSLGDTYTAQIIDRVTGSGDFAPLDVLSSNQTDYEDATVVAGVTYSYRVRGVKGGYPTPYSNTATTTVAAFVPTAIAGLTGWYRGSSLVLSDGSSVATWTDESGNSNDATQAVESNKPIYRATGGPNSKPCIQVDSSVLPQYLLANGLSSTFVGSAPTFTFFVVSSFTDVSLSGVNYTVLSAKATGTSVYQQLTLDDTPEILYRENDDPGTHAGTIVDANPILANTPEIYTVTSNNIATMYRNGTSSGTTNVPGTHDFTPNRIAFGADVKTLVTDGSNAKISEIIIYNSVLSSTDLNSVGNYLATKYGFTWNTI